MNVFPFVAQIIPNCVYREKFPSTALLQKKGCELFQRIINILCNKTIFSNSKQNLVFLIFKL